MVKRIGILVLLVVAGSTACSGSEAASTPDVDSSDSTNSGSASVESFCVEYASLQGEQPEAYVGSSEHLADIDRLLAVAPDPVAPDLMVFRDFISSGAIDSEADPESNQTETWPGEVQAAIESTQTFAVDVC